MRPYRHREPSSAVPVWLPLILALLVVLLASCGEKVQTPVDISAGQNIQVEAFEWRIRTAEELREQYLAAGMILPKEYATSAFVARDLTTGQMVIYTTPPKYVDDGVTRDLGHEVMHLALGDYHKQKGK